MQHRKGRIFGEVRIALRWKHSCHVNHKDAQGDLRGLLRAKAVGGAQGNRRGL
jgi:hypothetical protein